MTWSRVADRLSRAKPRRLRRADLRSRDHHVDQRFEVVVGTVPVRVARVLQDQSVDTCEDDSSQSLERDPTHLSRIGSGYSTPIRDDTDVALVLPAGKMLLSGARSM